MTPESAARPLRLLIVTPRFFPYLGGIETHVYEVGRRMVAHGLDVTVLSSDPGGSLPVHDELEGMHLRRVRAWPRNLDLYIAPDIYRVIANGSWDLVHCQGVHTFVPPTAMLASLRARLPYVLTFHTGGHSSSSRHAIRDTQWKVLGPLLRRANRLISVSRFEVGLFQHALHLPTDRFVVIRNGGRLPDVPENDLPRAPGTLIVAVGRLEQYKGHQRAIAALPHLRREYPDARLRIVGTGPYEGELRTLARRLGVSDLVQIEGIPPQDRSGMARVILSASLVTLLSDYEAHPIAVMEALALGRPVLAADTSGLSELAEEGLIRAIPADSSPEQVAAAMAAQLRDPLIPADVHFPTWEECVHKLLAVYNDVLGC
jgi:glycosyltransferase involved in cell wall biosynthesis